MDFVNEIVCSFTTKYPDQRRGRKSWYKVTNSESLNSKTLVFSNVASFSLVLDLMHEWYVISFVDVFHFLIWESACFVAYFHISVSQKLRDNKIGMPFLTLRPCEIDEKLKLWSTNKTHVYFLLVTFDVLKLYVVTDKSKCLCAIFHNLIHSNPKILQISFVRHLSYNPFR